MRFLSANAKRLAKQEAREQDRGTFIYQDALCFSPAFPRRKVSASVSLPTQAAVIAALVVSVGQAFAQPAVGSSGSASSPSLGHQLERVEITGSTRGTDERANSITTRIVVNRDEISKNGDRALTDVLRRLPGVTVTNQESGSQIRMRGLGAGYTQIQVDGVIVGPTFSIDSLSPETIERIEIIRAATAESGAQAIAGTINIVLRQTSHKTSSDFKLSVGTENARPNYGLSASFDNKFEQLTYLLAASLDRRVTRQLTDLYSRAASEVGVQTSERFGYRDYPHLRRRYPTQHLSCQ